MRLAGIVGPGMAKPIIQISAQPRSLRDDLGQVVISFLPCHSWEEKEWKTQKHDLDNKTTHFRQTPN